MKNLIIKITFLFLLVSLYGQENKLWTGHFSYNDIKDVSEGDSKIFVGAQNACFKKDLATNQTVKITTVDGLSGYNITQVFQSKNFNKTIVGYENGLIIVINDKDGSMFNVVDILNKASVPQNAKRINHFMEYKGKLYIATGYGISVLDIATTEFGDTFYIGPGGSNIAIMQTTVYNNEIYAVANSYGILKANVDNPNLIDFNQWTVFSGGSWVFVESIGSKLVAQYGNGQIYSFVTGGSLQVSTSLAELANDARFSGGNLIVTLSNSVVVFNDQLTSLATINAATLGVYNFKCATKIATKIYIGTLQDGVQVVDLSNTGSAQNITPDGPTRNRVFRLKSFSKGFWAVYGDYSTGYNPYPLDSYGVSKFTDDMGWKHIPYQNLFNAKSIAGVLVNPKNENEVFLSSYYSGLIQVVNDVPSKIYNTSNSSLVTIPGQVPDDLRVAQPSFDKNGNMWMATSLTNSPLHQFKASQQWAGYNLNCIVSLDINSYNGVEIDKNGTKWIASNHSGVVGYNEAKNKCIVLSTTQSQGGLPSEDVRVAVVDNKNKLWIGTSNGVRVVQNVDSFLTQNQLTSNAIIILENGTAEELFFDQFISDIVVDGANNKWIATAGAGVFYISTDGQKTYKVFTKENSPLPNNTVLDIDINQTTGEVFFVTEGGVVSYNGVATKGKENFDNVMVYPNPVRPEYNGNVMVTGLMDKANVKITDIEGNLVYEATSEGGTVEWDTKVFGKNKVASGVYVIFLAAEDGTETEVKKVMIVR